ncbi:MAG: glycerol-3-phosphate 1-O-acyltransferase PlsY [Dehalococcoidia bacterium]|nr:glycerol-3-phosphate 1-O-acyltransferase PlsY [Dehalococcoidia bacterium]
MIEFAAVILGSYLIGSIPSGFIAGKLKGVDVRQYGSGKTGSANVMRTIGRKAAAAVFMADVLKGVSAVFLAGYTIGSPVAEMAAGFAAIAGHDWSVFMRFQGGRGVATSLGGQFAILAWVGFAGLGVFALLLVVFRYVSLASLLGAFSAVAIMIALTVLGLVPYHYLIYTAVAVSVIFIQHRDNISRLLSGSELKLGEKGERRQEIDAQAG